MFYCSPKSNKTTNKNPIIMKAKKLSKELEEGVW